MSESRQRPHFDISAFTNASQPAAVRIDHGERRLFAAIINRAVADAMGRIVTMYDREYNVYQAAAMRWLCVYDPLTEEEIIDPSPFSFPWLCCALGIDPEYGRERVVAWLAQEHDQSLPYLKTMAHGLYASQKRKRRVAFEW